jgi:hypothetical protein
MLDLRFNSTQATILVLERKLPTLKSHLEHSQRSSTCLVETTSSRPAHGFQSSHRLFSLLLVSTDSFLCFHCSFWAFNSTSRSWANYTSFEMQVGVNRSSVIGQFNATNYPTPRSAGATWVDDKGYLWLFGGHTGATRNAFKNGTFDILTANRKCETQLRFLLADLWVFNPYSKMWALVMSNNFTAPTCSYPIFRSRATTFSNGGNHYLYGGTTNEATYLQDFWRLTANVTLISCPAGSETVGEGCYACTDGKVSTSGVSCSYCLAGSVGNNDQGIGSTEWCVSDYPAAYAGVCHLLT